MRYLQSHARSRFPRSFHAQDKRDMNKVVLFTLYIYTFMSLVNQNKSSDVISAAEILPCTDMYMY